MSIRVYFLSLVAAAVMLTVLAAPSATADDLTVIDLRNRTAEEVLPTLRPLVGPDVALSGLDYKLLVRGSASDVARIRDALAVLDKAPRQLLISVRYNGLPQSKATDVGVAGTITNSGSHIAARGNTSLHTATDSNVSTVRVLEGNAARISTGQSVPIISALMLPSRSHRQTVIVGMNTDYRELTSGFDVVPRVNGERVVLDISTQQERALGNGHFNNEQSNLGQSNLGQPTAVQRTMTTVAGRIGEWIELGGVTSSVSEQHTSVGVGGASHRVTTQSDQRTIAVKVEQVD